MFEKTKHKNEFLRYHLALYYVVRAIISIGSRTIYDDLLYCIINHYLSRLNFSSKDLKDLKALDNTCDLAEVMIK